MVALAGSMSVSTQTTRTVRDPKETAPVRRATLVAWICLLIVYVVWGSTYLAIRVGVETIPPLLLAAARRPPRRAERRATGNMITPAIAFRAAASSSGGIVSTPTRMAR